MKLNENRGETSTHSTSHSIDSENLQPEVMEVWSRMNVEQQGEWLAQPLHLEVLAHRLKETLTSGELHQLIGEFGLRIA